MDGKLCSGSISHSPSRYYLSFYYVLIQNAGSFLVELVASKRVLELGSGVGFLAIIVASLQGLQNPSVKATLSGSSLWMTDVNDDVLARCRDNINLPCSKHMLRNDAEFPHISPRSVVLPSKYTLPKP